MIARRFALVALACLWTPAVPARAQDSVPPPLRQARALLAAGKVEDAVHAAERYTRRHPKDERGFLVLGDAYFKRMPAGRYLAVRSYREAERLAPRDPLPPYRLAQAGLWLGGDDGEIMAKDGLERVLELDPFYRDAWDEWLTLFRNSGSRRKMRERLARFDSVPGIKARIALLDIEDERYAAADSLLDSALSTDSNNVAWLALRAQSAFEAGDTAVGWDVYSRALAHADLDSTGALWHQVVGIAQPWEIEAWAAGVPPAERRTWLESFWARRNPDLFAGVNRRVAEHFARLRYARKHYPLLHPAISYHRSQIARAMDLEPSAGERAYNVVCEMYETLYRYHPAPPRVGPGHPIAPYELEPVVGVSDSRDRARLSPNSFATVSAAAMMSGAQLSPAIRGTLFAPMNLDLRSMDTVAARVGYNLATGLDDRGVMYLRFGPPDDIYVGGKNVEKPECNSRDVERWRYDGYGEVRFARPSAFSRGERNVPDMIFRAMNERQFALVERGLTEDHSSEPAPLVFGVWTAQFADPASMGRTDLVIVSTRGMIAASVVGLERPGARWIGTHGWVSIPAPPADYVMLAQAEDSGLLGRQTLRITVKPFLRLPAVSELLLAPAWPDTLPTRAAMLAHLERTLTFPAGSTIRSYAEVYGLQPAAGIVRYRVSYALLHTGNPARDFHAATWPNATRFEFTRERRAAASGTEVETLDLVPSDVPAGKYLLRLTVEDLATGRNAGTATIAFVVR